MMVIYLNVFAVRSRRSLVGTFWNFFAIVLFSCRLGHHKMSFYCLTSHRRVIYSVIKLKQVTFLSTTHPAQSESNLEYLGTASPLSRGYHSNLVNSCTEVIRFKDNLKFKYNLQYRLWILFIAHCLLYSCPTWWDWICYLRRSDNFDSRTLRAENERRASPRRRRRRRRKRSNSGTRRTRQKSDWVKWTLESCRNLRNF